MRSHCRGCFAPLMMRGMATFFLLKREASITVRTYNAAACHGGKEK